MEIHILESLCGVAAVGQEWTGELMKKKRLHSIGSIWQEAGL